jgi:hypothetical protein
MEDLKDIEQLLEKYYDGETTLEEERKLQWFFQTQDVPERLHSEKKMFSYYHTMKKEASSPGLTDKLIGLVDGQERLSGRFYRRRVIAWAGSAAAVIVILLAVWLSLEKPITKQAYVFQDTYDNPELAYMEARKVLILVSEKMNEGTRNLENFNKINKGMENLKPVFSFGPGIQHLDKLSTFGETIDLITKKQ